MNDKEMRLKILRAIYKEMRDNPEGYGLYIGDLEKLVSSDYKFNLRYLIEKGWVKNTYGYLTLTAEGIDEVEKF